MPVVEYMHFYSTLSKLVHYIIVEHLLETCVPLATRSRALLDRAPTDLTVGLGDTANFTCAASGQPVPQVRWFINSQPIEQVRCVYAYN